MMQLPYKIMAVTLVGTAIVLAAAFLIALPFNLFM
jgi:hypothetical protein